MRTDSPIGIAAFLVPMVAACSLYKSPPDRTPPPVAAHPAAPAPSEEQLILGRLERTLPPDHPDVQQARLDCANALRERGDLQGARALEETALDICLRKLPPDHPDLARARAALARTLFELGDLTGARALQETVLGTLERVLPPDHPDVLRARMDLARTRRAMGDTTGETVRVGRMIEAEGIAWQLPPRCAAVQYIRYRESAFTEMETSDAERMLA